MVDDFLFSITNEGHSKRFADEVSIMVVGECTETVLVITIQRKSQHRAKRKDFSEKKDLAALSRLTIYGVQL